MTRRWEWWRIGGLALAIIGAPGLMAPAPVVAQQAAVAPAVPDRPYELANTVIHRFHSPSLGRDYDISITLPFGYDANPARRYPVLFVTDTPQSIPFVTGLHRRLRGGGRGLDDAIIVGLGYAVGDTGVHSRRRDYTPTPHGDIDAQPEGGKPVEYGGAEAYRLHLKTELFPWLEANYQIDPARRIYLGHSYGGLFGTHVLLTDPAMFQRYILISPSLWYDRKLMIARERGYAMTHKDMPAEAYFMVGGLETVAAPDSEPFGDSRNAMVEDQAEMVANLQSRHYPSLVVKNEVIAGQDHGSVWPDAVRKGLEWALNARPRLPAEPCRDEQGRPTTGCRKPDFTPQN